MSRSPLLLFSLAVSLFLSGCSSIHKAEIAGLLLQYKHDEQAKAESAGQESVNFVKAKDALLASQGQLQPFTQARTRELFGEPSSMFQRDGCDVWGYKPGDADWFHGEKIFLSFDRQGLLSSAHYLPPS